MTPWFRRQLALADYTLAARARRRIKNIGLVAIYALVVFVVASAMLFSTALRHEAETVLADAPELIVQNLVMGRHDMIDASEIEKLAESRTALSGLMEGVAAERWSRVGRHEAFGPISIYQLLRHCIWHDHRHLEAIRRLVSD